MITSNSGDKILEPGDIIESQGIKVTVKRITYQSYDRETDTFIAEFYDTEGNFRHWHQSFDNGTVTSKPVTKDIFVGFENASSNPEETNFHCFDAMKIFNTEHEALEWRDINPDFRIYKYCGSIPV